MDDGAAAVVLAAGEGRRFGRQKLLMPLRGSTVVGCVVACLRESGADPIVVVTGPDSGPVADALRGEAVHIVPNPQPDRGMVSSVRLGVAALPPGITRFILALGDQPGVTTSDVARLLERHRRRGAGIAIATHHGKRGHPVVFDAAYRAQIAALSDEQTLRDVIHGHAQDVVEVECSEATIRDIDTREHYEDELQRGG
jgi:CTP:molybdopterin cytidylyltransferase MocA